MVQGDFTALLARVAKYASAISALSVKGLICPVRSAIRMILTLARGGQLGCQ